MTTTYLHVNADQCWTWHNQGLCGFCGSPPNNDGCFCRHCDSCSEDWLADTLADSCDGRPPLESCPECRAEGY
jgi:hypothetical protein